MGSQYIVNVSFMLDCSIYLSCIHLTNTAYANWMSDVFLSATDISANKSRCFPFMELTMYSTVLMYCINRQIYTISHVDNKQTVKSELEARRGG